MCNLAWIGAVLAAAGAGCGGDKPSRPGPPTVVAAREKPGSHSGLFSDNDESLADPNGTRGGPSGDKGHAASGLSERLAKADALVRENRFDEAAAAIDQALASSPSDAEKQQAAGLKAKLDDRRRAFAELVALVPKLASQDRREVVAAQDRFFERGDVSAVVLGEAVRTGDEPTVRAAVATLAHLRRPQEAAAPLIEVLGRPERKALWPDAVAAMETACPEGAGGPLLTLALSTQDAAQRVAALRALARAADPPLATVPAVLPWVHSAGPELAAALEALARTVEVHRLHDLATRRGWDMELSPQAEKQLDELPGRIADLLKAPAPHTAAAARRLAILTRQVPADPIPGVKVLAFSAERDDGRAGAVLDGQWNTTDPSKMWRYPADKPGSIVLDLGQSRTVCGVRIWNVNESNAGRRGWKDVAVYVDDSPALLVVPAATVQIAPAPGAAEVPDYSITVPVDFRRGRYVRLRAASLWSQDQTTGLAEVQVLGF